MLTVIVHLPGYSVSAGWPCGSGRVGEHVAIATCEDRPGLALAADSPELITNAGVKEEGPSKTRMSGLVWSGEGNEVPVLLLWVKLSLSRMRFYVCGLPSMVRGGH